MPEFAFDMVLNTAILVKADNLEAAVAYLREQLDCFSPEVGWQLPVGGARDVESAALAEISLGNHTTTEGKPAPALSLFRVDGNAIADVSMDDMQQPHVCDRWMETDDLGGVECHEVYDEAIGDGYCGMCPACADAEED